MCDVEIKINASWQLVSQFVSWDFCRFMCEQKDSQSSGSDVLTFLSNMVVARTEKRATDITKQEVVAKFIMEVRTIQSKTRMPCIITLSDTVIKICPELKSPMQNLLHHLESLLNILDWIEDSQKDEQLILAQLIQQSVNEFSVEACKLLPLPDLLQINLLNRDTAAKFELNESVVSSWISPELQSQVWKARQKNVTNIEQDQRVVQKETITVFEANTIAKALYEDKTLEKTINSETKTDPPDSQQNTPSFHLQPRPTLSEQSFQESPRGSSVPEKQLDSAGLFTLEPVYLPSQPWSQFIQSPLPFSQNSLDPFEQNSLDPFEQYSLTEGIQNLGPLNPIESYLFKPVCPEPLFSTLSPKGACPQVYLEDSQSEVDHSPQKSRKSSMLDNTLSSKKRRKILSSSESNNSKRNLSPMGACPQVYLDESQSKVYHSPMKSRKSSKLANTLSSKKRRKILSSSKSDNSKRNLSPKGACPHVYLDEAQSEIYHSLKKSRKSSKLANTLSSKKRRKILSSSKSDNSKRNLSPKGACPHVYLDEAQSEVYHSLKKSRKSSKLANTLSSKKRRKILSSSKSDNSKRNLSPKGACPHVYLDEAQSEVYHSLKKSRKSSKLDNTLSSKKRQKILSSSESDNSKRNLSPKGACPHVYLDESQSKVCHSPIKSRKSSKLDNTLSSKKRRKILSSSESDNSKRNLSPKGACPQVYLDESQSEVYHSSMKSLKSSKLDNTLSSKKRRKILSSSESDNSKRNLSPKGACPQVYLDESQSEVYHSPMKSRKSSKLDNSLLSKKRRKILSSSKSDNSPRKSGRVSSPEPIFFTAPVETPERNFVPDHSDSADFSRKNFSATSKKRKKKCLRMIESDLSLSDVEVDRELIAPQRTSYAHKSSNNNTSSNLFGDISSNTSDCNKNPEFRFLTPTMHKTGTLEENPAASNRVIWMSDDEDHVSSITTDLSRVSISTKALPKAKAKPPAERTTKKHMESPKFTNSPRQATLGGFGFSSTTSNQKESPTNKEVEKKRFKLSDNDLMPNIANETALFQKTTAKKTQKTTKKWEDLGKKRRCTECKKTFRSNLLLRKHVFIEHATEDLNSSEEFM